MIYRCPCCKRRVPPSKWRHFKKKHKRKKKRNWSRIWAKYPAFKKADAHEA